VKEYIDESKPFFAVGNTGTAVNIAPVVVCPYHYPQLLKDEIEKQCDDMLQ
jgi:hypothetical protein